MQNDRINKWLDAKLDLYPQKLHSNLGKLPNRILLKRELVVFIESLIGEDKESNNES